MRGREKSNRGREVGEKGEGSGGDGGGNWGEWGRELGMWYPPVHPLMISSENATPKSVTTPLPSIKLYYFGYIHFYQLPLIFTTLLHLA